MFQLPETIEKAAELLARAAVKARMEKSALDFSNPAIKNPLIGAGLGAAAGGLYSAVDKDRRKDMLRNSMIGGGMGAAGGLGYHFLSGLGGNSPKIDQKHVGPEGKLNPGIDPTTGQPHPVNTPGWVPRHESDNTVKAMTYSDAAKEEGPDFNERWYPGGKPGGQGYMNFMEDALYTNNPRRTYEMLSNNIEGKYGQRPDSWVGKRLHEITNPQSMDGNRPSDWVGDQITKVTGQRPYDMAVELGSTAKQIPGILGDAVDRNFLPVTRANYPKPSDWVSDKFNDANNYVDRNTAPETRGAIGEGLNDAGNWAKRQLPNKPW